MRIIGGAIILVIAVWLYVVSTRMLVPAFCSRYYSRYAASSSDSSRFLARSAYTSVTSMPVAS